MNEKMRGLDLFSGYGGISIGLSDHVTPVVYCEIESYARAILLSRMDDGAIPFAPIWNDVTTLDGRKLRGLVDIVYGGFPCQDISVAGKGAGLEGKRSGLFGEVTRLCKEASPTFVFLENVPAIRTRGSVEVSEALASLGYDLRWCTLSASQVGAPHKRERWFLLAHSDSAKLRIKQGRRSGTDRKRETEPRHNGQEECLADSYGAGRETGPSTRNVQKLSSPSELGHDLPDSDCSRLQTKGPKLFTTGVKQYGTLHSKWWEIEPDVGRVVNGLAFRPHRLKALGNGVVPLQVKTAFEYLMGISKLNHDGEA